jgi:hypothetical protein
MEHVVFQPVTAAWWKKIGDISNRDSGMNKNIVFIDSCTL